MENKPRIIKLSKYFNENVQLIAGVCPKCYAESSEVKITAVNRKFLKITNQNHLLENILTIFTKDKVNLKQSLTSFDENFQENGNINLGNSSEITETNSCNENVRKDMGHHLSYVNKENCKDVALKYFNNSKQSLDLHENQMFNSNFDNDEQTKPLEQGNFLGDTVDNTDLLCDDKKIVGMSCNKIRTSKFFLRNHEEDKLDAFENIKEMVSNRDQVVKFNNISTKKQALEIKTNSTDTELMLKNDTVGKSSIYFGRKSHNTDKTLQTISLKRKEQDYNAIKTSLDSPLVLDKKETSITEENVSKLSLEDQDILPLSQCVSRALTDEEIKDPSSCSFCREKLLHGCSQSSDYHEISFNIYEPKIMAWVPPKSPHNLIEESLSRDPWALLVATIFLNKTSCMVARQYVEEFLQDNPSPHVVLKKDSSELVKYFINLGLHQRRAEQVWKMTHDFLHKKWKRVGELYGIGQYGEDTYRMFCLGDMSFRPKDRFLRIYRAWYKMNFSQRDSSFFELQHTGDGSSSENSD